ncbi:MAG: M15 family metallopeptidase [Acutalibacteraceae bacterium]
MSEGSRHGKKPSGGKNGLRIAVAVCCFLAAAGAILLWALIGGQIPPASSAPGETTAPATTTTTAPPTRTQTQTTALSPASVTHYRQTQPPVWSLLLVNKWNRIPDGYEDAITIVDYDGAGNRIDERVKGPLMELIAAGEEYHFWGMMLYRDGKTQQAYFDAEVERQKAKGFSDSEAQVMAANEVVRPGTSDHQTGMAIDLIGGDFAQGDLAFGDSEAGKWLAAHCADYGFILRYPKGKEAITGMEYEPWHIRYVGVEHAKAIMSRGLTLEEYLEQLDG